MITSRGADLGSVLDVLPIGVVLVDLHGTVLLWSAGAERLLGWRTVEAVGRPLPRAMFTADELRALARTLEVAGSVSDIELTRERSDGRTIDLNIAPALVRSAHGDPAAVALAISDITGRKHAEVTDRREHERIDEAVRQGERRFRMLADRSPVGIYQIDPDRHLLYVNRALLDMLEVPEHDDVHNYPFEQFFTPETLSLIRVELARRARGIASTYEGEVVGLNGTHCNVLISGAPLFDDRGVFQSSIGTMIDITERKRLERRSQQAQKMETVGRLAGGVAHDFNNMLTAIIGNAEFALTSIDDDEARQDVTEIHATAQRAAELTRQLLMFSRHQVEERSEVVDLNEVIAGVDRMLRRLVGEDLTFVARLAPEALPVRLNRQQFEQVLANLVLNARDAMPDGGQLTIATGPMAVGEHDRAHADLPAGRYATVNVIDTGAGMSTETQQHLFEPFFTTKELGHGTGLGLAIAYRIVTNAGGAIAVDSKVGRGTSIEIALPLAAAPAATPAPGGPPAPLPGGSESILLVEDEDAVRAVTARTLRELGYAVVEARDGESALAIVNDAARPVDLLVTDVVMPGMGGPKLAEAAASLRPGIRVLYTSGYTGPVAGDSQIAASGRPLLPKPFDAAALARAVRLALGSPA